MRQHPEVDCLVRSGWHEAMLTLLLDGLVELALVAWPCPPALEPELRLLFTLREPVVLVAGRRHALVRLARVRAEDMVRLGRPFYRLRWWQAHHPAIDRLAERTRSDAGVADGERAPSRRTPDRAWGSFRGR